MAWRSINCWPTKWRVTDYAVYAQQVRIIGCAYEPAAVRLEERPWLVESLVYIPSRWRGVSRSTRSAGLVDEANHTVARSCCSSIRRGNTVERPLPARRDGRVLQRPAPAKGS